jgi:hypothetical protein
MSTALSHSDLVKEIVEHTPEVNLYEHKSKFSVFVGRILLWGLIGAVIGGVLERLILILQGKNRESQPRLKCLGFSVVSLLIIATTFYVTLRIVSRTFDDWLMGTISGFTFALTFFDSFESLGDNVKCVFRE